MTGAMTWREVLPGPFRPTHGFELSWSMLKTWPVRAEALLVRGPLHGSLTKVAVAVDDPARPQPPLML